MQTALLVSCDDPDAIAAALEAGPDALVFDVAGPPASRPTRREEVLAALLDVSTRMAPPRRIIHLEGLDSDKTDGDLDVLMAGAPDAVLLPRAQGPASVERLGAKLAVREAELGFRAGSTRIIAAPAETGAGLLALPRLAEARSRLAALLWNPAALAADLGAIDPEGEPCRVARTLVLAAAAACGVPAIEAVPLEHDAALMSRRDAARRDGFSGLLLCRPDQLHLVRG